MIQVDGMGVSCSQAWQHKPWCASDSGRTAVDSDCLSQLHSAVWMKYWVRDQGQGHEPGELDVGEKNYLLRVILEILLQCCVLLLL